MVDACCGAGADAVAIASRGCPVTAVDADPAMTLLAEINARRQGLSIRTITQPLSMQLVRDLASDHAGIHIDPDRRPDDRRTSRGDAFSPPITEVLEYAEQFANAVIKLAPSTRLDEEVERERSTTDSHVYGSVIEVSAGSNCSSAAARPTQR